MADYVTAATEPDGQRLGERVSVTAPTLDEVAEFGDRHQADYVSVRHDHDVTVYARDAAGTWSVLVADAPAPVAVELRRQHAESRPRTARRDRSRTRDSRTAAPAPDRGYVLTALDVDGEQFGQLLSPTPPTLGEAAELGSRHEADYVTAGRDEGDMVTLYGRDETGSWSVVAADVDVETAGELCLWFDLTHHYLGGDPDHPLAHLPTSDEDGRMPAERAIALVQARIRSREPDYPVEGLQADRFEGGWSVYAPVEVDESDPMAFLDMPVDRAVFLVSDLGRVKQTTTAIPPHQAEALFTGEEAFVRRPLAGEEFMAGLQAAFAADRSEDAPAISGFTVVDPPEEAIAARAAALIGPVTQWLALLGPPEWDSLTAVFSFTVAAEVAQLEFGSRNRHSRVPVPEPIAVLVRRQRHLAARMSAGPWCRLLLTVRRTGRGAEVSTRYDYGDEPLPQDQLLAPEHYRADLVAYPRGPLPAWLAAYLGEAASGGAGARPAPATPCAPAASAPEDAGTGAGNRPAGVRDTAAVARPSGAEDASARAGRIGREKGLGALRGTYPAELLPGGRLGGFGTAALLLAILGIVMVATSDVLGVIPLAIAVAFIAYVVRGAAANDRHRGTCLATFESGAVFVGDGDVVRVFRWDDTIVRQRIVDHHRNGAYTHTTYAYDLTGTHGVQLSLGGGSATVGLAHPETWGREIQEGVTRAQLPGALETIAGGGTVSFGPLRLDRQAVTANGRSIPWSDVEQVKVEQGRVSVRVAGKWLSLITVEVSRVQNFFVFHALAERLHAAARGA